MLVNFEIDFILKQPVDSCLYYKYSFALVCKAIINREGTNVFLYNSQEKQT